MLYFWRYFELKKKNKKKLWCSFPFRDTNQLTRRDCMCVCVFPMANLGGALPCPPKLSTDQEHQNKFAWKANEEIKKRIFLLTAIYENTACANNIVPMMYIQIFICMAIMQTPTFSTVNQLHSMQSKTDIILDMTRMTTNCAQTILQSENKNGCHHAYKRI